MELVQVGWNDFELNIVEFNNATANYILCDESSVYPWGKKALLPPLLMPRWFPERNENEYTVTSLREDSRKVKKTMKRTKQ